MKDNPHRKVRILLKAFVVSLIFMSAVTSTADMKPGHEKPLVLVADINQNSKAFRALSLLYTEAFHRVGRTFIFRRYPGKRAALMTEKGLADGQLCRVHSFSEKYKSLVRVEEPLYTVKILALTASPDVNIEFLSDLRNTPYTVNFKRGTLIAEQLLAGLVPPDKLEIVNSYQSGLKKLTAGRADLFIANEAPLRDILISEEFKDSGIRIESILYETTAHLFLHVRHRELAPKLSIALKEIKKEGLIEKYKKEAGFKFIHPQ